MNRCCGIDFGTSNSAIGIVEDDAVKLVEVEDDKITIPSALFFPNIKDAKTIYGRQAVKAYIANEEGRFMRSLKRVLGTSLMQQRTQVNRELLSFYEIIGRFVRNMKLKSEAAGYELENVVMGRPVHFVDYDHAADGRAENELREIAQLAGFKNIEFQFEPIAAAFAHERNLKNEKLSLVVDIGGGTSDFTVIRLSPDRKDNIERKQDILSNSGVRIGGNDFDKDLSVKSVMTEFGYESSYGDKNLLVPRSYFHDISEWSKVNFVYSPKTLREFNDMLRESFAKGKLSRFINVLEHQLGHRVLDSIENAKIELTNINEYDIDFGYIEPNFILSLKEDNLNSAIAENVDKVIVSAKECLKSAKVKAKDIELIILTGGSTEIPYIQQLLSRLFPNAELSQENKLSSVALGLAYDSKRRFA